MHNLKVENYVYLADFLRTQAGEVASQIAVRNYSKEVREEPGYIGGFATKTSEDLPLVKENQMSQVNEFSTFLCMGRCKSLGSLKSFL